jgi:hypothetical protein
MQISTWARPRPSSQWWIGRRSRSSALIQRKSRSTRERSLAGGHGAGGVELAGRERGGDDVDAVQGGFGVGAVLVAAPGQAVLADVQDEVLGHLMSDAPHPAPTRAK